MDKNQGFLFLMLDFRDITNEYIRYKHKYVVKYVIDLDLTCSIPIFLPIISYK